MNYGRIIFLLSILLRGWGNKTYLSSGVNLRPINLSQRMYLRISFLTLLFICIAISGQSPYPAFSQRFPVAKKYNCPVEYYIKDAESNNEAYLELASFMKEQGEYNESIRYLKEYLRRENNKKAKLLLGEVYYLNGNSINALSVLKRLNIKGCEYEIYLYLGLIYEDLNDTGLAVKYYEKSMGYRKTSISLYRLGKIFYKEGNYQKAERFFENLVSYDGSNRLAYYYLGDSYFRQGIFPEAYKYLLKASYFYPKSALIGRELSIAKRQLGKEYFLSKEKELLGGRKKVKLAAYRPLSGDIPKVRVAVLKKTKEVSFKSSGRITVEYGNKSVELKGNKLYTIKLEKEKVVLKNYDDSRVIAFLKCPVVLSSYAHPFYILGAVYGRGSFWQSTLDLSLRGKLEIINNGGYLTAVNVLNVEEYLYGVLPAEIYPTSPPEALKAQAVAARTLVFKSLARHRNSSFNFSNDVHYQVYKGIRGYLSTKKAVDATRGQVMMYKGKLIEALYHSNCGGCLRNDAFGKRDYLENKLDNSKGGNFKFTPWNLERWFKSYPESFCLHTDKKSNFRWQRVYDAQDFSIVYGVPIGKLVKINVLKRGQCGHVRSLDVEFVSRKIMLDKDLKIRRFLDDLKSSAFITEVKYTRNGRNVVPGLILFWGAGFGHGEGMCQQGASAMAKDGYTYREILRHYYGDVDIEKIY